MKAADYIVEFFVRQGIRDFFGYQGTMIAHLIDSIGKNKNARNHSCYNEQGAAFAGCGYAKASGQCAVVYATSGPGAINLLSGVADAYYDSVPVVFLTGQLNTYEYTDVATLRQQGFQETNIVAMASPITKYAVQVRDKNRLPQVLRTAFRIAREGRRGPVLIDLPMNIQREEIELPPDAYEISMPQGTHEADSAADFVPGGCDVYSEVYEKLCLARRPVLLIGNGFARDYEFRETLLELIDWLRIPVVTSLPARDLLPADHPLNFGYLGAAYGHRYANIIVDRKADFLLSLGCSLCPRQTGQKTEKFAAGAEIVRIDLDASELMRGVHADEIKICADARDFVRFALKRKSKSAHEERPLVDSARGEWLLKCRKWRDELRRFDVGSEGRAPNLAIEKIGAKIPTPCVICSDVGQHQLWMAQSFPVKLGQRMLFSGGHGAMGFALPAAIGAHYATGMPSVCFCGDGGFQMNIQELQWVAREHLPVLIVILNNHSLGLIRQQQDDFFDSKYFGAASRYGYETPNFCRIGTAYGIESHFAADADKAAAFVNAWNRRAPLLIECVIEDTSKAYPKTYFGERMSNQKPYISEAMMEEILSE